MPTYQYACTSCGEQIEAVQRFTDDPLTVCPACGGGLRKVFSPVGIVFKGSGFYRTDSRNGSVASGDKDKSAAKANGSGDGKPGDGKPSDGKQSAESSSSSTGSKKTADKKPAGAGSSA